MNTLRTKKAILFCFLSFSTLGLSAQITFTNQADLFANQEFHSGVPMGICDMNNDGLDDMIRLDNRDDLYIEFQNIDGSFTSMFLDDYGDDDTWMVAAADVNNDGFNDLMTGGRYDNVKCYTRQTDGTYNKVLMPGATIFSQASNFADINNDGWLDIFVCHDDDASRIWENNGDGSYDTGDDLIDLNLYSGNNNSGNYGSVWTDFDNDGDLDFYIAKCRQGANSSTDLRRINQLFVNDGANNYTEQAEEYGLKIGAQSWTADFGDYDNDGDMDCFITNHDAPSQILENDGTGHFTDMTTAAGIDIDGLAIQGMMHDFDNDGWLDIAVSGTQQYMYHNNADGTFTEITNAFPDMSNIESFAVGDLNNDGFLDMLCGYAQVFNTPSIIDDALFMNSGNSNNWLRIKPTGTISNASGVGARIEILGDFGIQIREIRAGESYGITNALKAHFGLGTSTGIEQVIVRWPSGLVSVIDNPEINQTLEIVEAGCMTEIPTISYEGETILCADSPPLTLTASEAISYQWSNGATTPSIEVTEAGIYNVVINDIEGCVSVSTPLFVTTNPDATPSIFINSPITFCEGGTVTLMASEADSYLWNTGETTQFIEASEEGEYTVEVPGYCESFTSEILDLSLDILIAETPVTENAVINEPGSVVLSATGDAPTWYDAPNDGIALYTGNEFTTPFISETTPYYVENLQNFPNGMANVGMEEHTGNSMYGGNQFNGTIEFEAFAPFTLRRARVYTDIPGERIIEVRTTDGTVLSAVTVNIPVGESVIDLDLEVPMGTNLELGTNTDTNNNNFGFNSARLQRNNTETEYPYVIDDIVSLNASSFGTDWYYYFYNWEIEKQPIQCLSERVEVLATVETSSIFENTSTESLILSPNPTQDFVSFELPEGLEMGGEILVFDITGKQILTQELSTSILQKVDFQGIANGVYLVKVIIGARISSGKVLKIK